MNRQNRDQIIQIRGLSGRENFVLSQNIPLYLSISFNVELSYTYTQVSTVCTNFSKPRTVDIIRTRLPPTASQIQSLSSYLHQRQHILQGMTTQKQATNRNNTVCENVP